MTMWMENPGTNRKRRTRSKARKRNPARGRKRDRRGRFLKGTHHRRRTVARTRRKSRESRAERSRAAKKGWRRRRRNPESRAKRRRVARSEPRNRRGQFTSRRRSNRRRTTHRRRYRRNPPRTRKLGGAIMAGLEHGAEAVAGKAVTRILPSLASLPTTGTKGIAVQGLSAVVVGLLADRFIPGEAADFVFAGAMMAPLEAAISATNLPYLSTALSSYPMLPAAGQGMAVALPGEALGFYPDEYSA